MPSQYSAVYADIAAERGRQQRLYGTQHHLPSDWISILGEEYGEVCKAYNEGKSKDYRKELVEVAAVAVAAIEDLDNKTKGEQIGTTGPNTYASP